MSNIYTMPDSSALKKKKKDAVNKITKESSVDF